MSAIPNMTKLVEVALPLGTTNKASAREKSLHHGRRWMLPLSWARQSRVA